MNLAAAEFLGAVASNAGDEFHVLWSAREMLRLLDPESDVKSVKVEGLPEDEIHAELGEQAQAADVTLLREGADGPVYRYLQLKHSASNPQSSWTWSRLLARRTPRKPYSSVLGKLAGLMQGTAFAGDFAIVTNQPLAPEVASDVARLIAGGRAHEPEDVALTAKLKKGLGLESKQLLTFLARWDLSGFASSSRMSMESELLQRLATMYDADARNDVQLLQRRVATLMLPESRNEPPVTREVLATWLGIGNDRMLYPAPSQLAPASPYVRRAVLRKISTILAAQRARPLRLHAGGGCGKTSLLCDLASALPEGSEVLIYDCYGGGYFLASDQRRHLPQHAFAQIGNELAVRFRTPLLLRRDGSVEPFEAFRNRVEIAAGLLSERNPAAFLVLCFDAVDNARKGANHWRDPCFLDLLSQASGWPRNVRIIVSCRTARLEEVGNAKLYDDFEVEPFNVEEVRELVALWQPTWPAELAQTFWDLTGGVARRIVYAIEGLPSDGMAQAIERLMPKATGIDPLFEQRVDEAGKHLGDADKVWHVLQSLARLPRPVPSMILADLANITLPELRDIAADVGGVAERDGGWSFHDEDFEAFVIDRPGYESASLLARAADLLFDRRLTDSYCASGLAEVLVAAHRFDALYDLVTRDEPPSEVLSKLEQQFVWSRRLALALRCCRAAADIATACSLLISSAEAIGRARLLEELTVDDLELAVRFAADEANRLVMVNQRHREKRPRLRLELARRTAASQPGAAKIHLRWWRAHLRDRSDAAEKTFEVDASDLAAEYAVMAALHGKAVARDNLMEWRPRQIWLPVFRLLCVEAAGRNLEDIEEALTVRYWPPDALAPMMAAALLAGADLDAPGMRDSLARLARTRPSRLRPPNNSGPEPEPVLAYHEAILFVAERALAYKDLHPAILELIDNVFPRPELEEPHHLYRLRSAGSRHARAHAIRERISGQVVQVSGWLPPKREVPKPQPPRRWRDGRSDKSPEQEWNEALSETTFIYDRLVDAARTTLAGLADGLDAAWLNVAKILRSSFGYNDRSRREPNAAHLLMRNHFVHAAVSGIDVVDFVSEFRNVLKSWSADNFQRQLDLAQTLAMVPNAHNAALHVLTSIANEAEIHPLPAGDRVKLLRQCARIALPIDEHLAGWLFGKAVDATSAVDFEARSALAAAGVIAAQGLDGNYAETAELAVRLGNAAGAVVESLGLAGDFEWGSVASWVAAASLPTGLAAALRWHDRGVARLSDTLKSILEARSEFTFAQRVAFATLASHDELDIDVATANAQSLPGWFVAPVLEQLAQGGQIGPMLEGFAAIEARAAVDAAAPIATMRAVRDRLSGWRQVQREDCELVNADGGADDAVDVEVTGVASICDEAEIRAALSSPYEHHGPTAHQFLDVAGRLSGPGLRITFLEIALQIGGCEGAFGEAIPEILKNWSNYPPAGNWARDWLPGYIAGALAHLFPWRYDDPEIVEAALAATSLGAAEQANILLDGIERVGERMNADMLYTLTGLIAARTPEDQRSRLFDGLLKRIETRSSHPAAVKLTVPSAEGGTSEVVANLLFAAMGDMDLRERWRAAHAGLALMRADDPAWRALSRCLETEGDDAYKGQPFYRYGAFEQLLMLLQRAAVERPSAVAPYSDLILGVARREPHAALRELGRSILLSLDRAGFAVLDRPSRDFVETINRSQLTPVERGRRASLGHRSTEERERKRRYQFDDIDAIPYWYRPVVDLFDISMESFLDRMEILLVDKWGYIETDSHWLQEPRVERLRHSDNTASRRHGTRPTIERLSYHIEWHAMMCVVGELITEVPLLRSRDGEGDRFLDWLSDSLPSLAPRWLADLRTTPPLEQRFWGIAPTHPPDFDGGDERREAAAREWDGTITSEVFDAECVSPQGLVVAADFELRWRGGIQRVSVHSALASPATALALGRALSTVRDRMDFALPDARYHEDFQVAGFELEAWLQSPEHSPRADRFDTRRGAITGIPVEPAGATLAEDLHFDFASSAWCSAAGVSALSIDQWGSDEAANGNGWRATADRHFLTRLLCRTDRSLIVNVEISRQIYGNDIERNPTRWQLYVLDAGDHLTRVERRRRDIGRYLVRREGLDNSVDTLGRWMLHRAAELDALSKASDFDSRSSLEREVETICNAFRTRAVN